MLAAGLDHAYAGLGVCVLAAGLDYAHTYLGVCVFAAGLDHAYAGLVVHVLAAGAWNTPVLVTCKLWWQTNLQASVANKHVHKQSHLAGNESPAMPAGQSYAWQDFQPTQDGIHASE